MQHLRYCGRVVTPRVKEYYLRSREVFNTEVSLRSANILDSLSLMLDIPQELFYRRGSVMVRDVLYVSLEIP